MRLLSLQQFKAGRCDLWDVNALTGFQQAFGPVSWAAMQMP